MTYPNSPSSVPAPQYHYIVEAGHVVEPAQKWYAQKRAGPDTNDTNDTNHKYTVI